MIFLWVGLGGFAGAVARYAVDGWVDRLTGGQFAFGTLLVNLSGSLLLGLLYAMAIERTALPAEIRGPVMIGFIGAYTTFSTLMLETWLLAERGALAAAALNVVGSVVLGFAALFVGLAIGRLAT